MSTINGMKINVLGPKWINTGRTWRERLFSWPWCPWVKTRRYLSPSPVEADDCFRVGDEIYCGVAFYDKLKKTLAATE